MVEKEISIDVLMEGNKSLFKLARLGAMRAQELSQGSPKLVEAGPTTKFTVIALREIMEKKVNYREIKKK